MVKFLSVISLFLCVNFTSAQDLEFQWTAGLSFDFGSHVKRIGLRFAANATYNFVQINLTTNSYYNFSSLVLHQKGFEVQAGLGAQFGFGKKDSTENNFIELAENNTVYKNSIGYAYLRYWDNQKTSQSAGILNTNFGPFTFLTENDLFGAGKGWRDRYRTGAFKIGYQFDDTKVMVNAVMWTGDFTGCREVRDTDYPARFGYRDNNKALFGNYSLGLLSLQVQQILPYKQMARIDLGVDSEIIRHSIQNIGMHDMRFYTDKMVKRELMHIPMLQSDGSAYLFRPNQKIKPTRFYYNLGLNNGVFY